MLLSIRLLGAFFLTYVVARIFRKVLANMALPEAGRIALAHLLSFGVLGAIAALTKSGSDLLREDAVLIYIVPQLIWLVIDLGLIGKTVRIIRRRA